MPIRRPGVSLRPSSTVAYYDFTFSAPKSVSVYEAALRATGNVEMAGAVSAAHGRAVGIAIEYAESRIAFTRTGW
ncbi:relaxase domain-containing protein, partial [Microbacterium sp. HSID17254]|uniref:relaxase domain-containing protein n=1 Tax=Microbacterium sp. HSID17254 TaxID=2419509 RepID=UPI0011D0A6E0